MKRIDLGSNKIIDCDAVLFVNGQEVFRLRSRDSDGRLVCDFDLRSEDGERIAKIAKNHIIVKGKDGFSYYTGEMESPVKDSNGNMIARVQEIGLEHIAITGDFWIDGLHVRITDDALEIGGNLFVGNTISGFRKAIVIEKTGLGIGGS